MATSNIKTFQLDTSPNIIFNITRGGEAVDLTGCTVRLRVEDPVTGAITNPDPDDICTITNPTGGVCAYSWNDDDLPDPGTYQANLQIMFPTLTPEGNPQRETYALTLQVTGIVGQN